MKIEDLKLALETLCQNYFEEASLVHQELTLVVAREKLLAFCEVLKSHPDLRFDMLMDVAGVDYLHYGQAEWETTQATRQGFDRAVERDQPYEVKAWARPRFAVAYQLLSVVHRHRLRLKVFLEEADLVVNSVTAIWPSANWFEREAFDLFGIFFDHHPDLRRILTDYGFVGHPFRKDFPLSGHVEVRYDASLQRVIYAPVEITPRVLVPKVIREPKI